MADSEPLLVERIRDEIAASPDVRITFARFMERALTEPGLGYYATSDRRPTRAGDFLTAPELHPFFGRCVARQLTGLWREMGEPPAFTVREYGAGRGMLEAAVRAGLRADGSGLGEALAYEGVDLPAPDPGGVVTGCIVANEFLDALPVHRVVRRRAELLERYVAWQDGWFVEVEGPLSSEALAEHLRADGVELAEGQAADISLAAAAWMRRWAAELERGWTLVIDYGHEAPELYGPRRMAGTLLGYRGHRLETDPFRAVGRTDLTAHVDITALVRAAASSGLTLRRSAIQGEWLAGLGLGEMLSELGRTPGTDPQRYLDARAAVVRLVDPRHLGGFRVLLFEKAPRAHR
jgi:SAM-dependent MidA family methyltransferase